MSAATTTASTVDHLAQQRAAQGLEPGVTDVATLKALASIFRTKPEPIAASSRANTARATKRTAS